MAPMAGITDRAFRTLMRELSSSVVVTELVSANGLEFGNHRTQKLMDYDESQRPIGVQLFGETPDVIGRGARAAEEMGVDFVDMNFGCPVPKVVKKGAGSALLKDLVALRDVLRAVKKRVQIPVTIKIRTGWDQQTRNASEVVQVAYDEGIEWVAIHGRTRSQAYTGQADWDYIAEVKAQSPLPILGNGDILTPQNAVERMKQYGVDGVMIGRGCLKNPWIFQESLSLWQAQEEKIQNKKTQNEKIQNREHLEGRETQTFSPSKPSPLDHLPLEQRTYLKVYERLHELLKEDDNERILQIQLKKFASWYSSGFLGSAQFRRNIFSTNETQEVLELAQSFFAELHLKNRADQSREKFLMGGHG